VHLAEPGLSTPSRQLFAKLADESHVALAVSGGADSVAMMRLALDWARDHGDSLKLSALTVDHGLRPESSAEAALVAKWCAALSLPHHILTWEGSKPATGVQAKARAARYGLMSAWCAANGAKFLLTAHTLDDQAETVLMRQRRTSTAESLAGIWETTSWNGIRIFRPLLGVRRAELRQHLDEIGQPWIDDPSNEDVRYERPRARRELASDDARMEALAGVAAAAGDEARRCVKLATDWNLRHLKTYPEGFGIVPRLEFSTLAADIQQRVLRQLIGLFGAGNCAAPRELVEACQWIAGPSLSRRTLGGAVVATRKRSIVVGRETGRISSESVFVPESGEIVWDGRFLINAPPGAQVVPVARIKNLGRRPDIPNFVEQALPAAMLCENLVVAPHLADGQGVSAKFIRYLR
jgi:tRNA(Ile)-lysidine synthase